MASMNGRRLSPPPGRRTKPPQRFQSGYACAILAAVPVWQVSSPFHE